MIHPIYRGRIILIGLVVLFALPAIAAKVILSQHWYQSGVTNKGELIEPTLYFSAYGDENPYQSQSWQLAYVVPSQCDAQCEQQLHLLAQSHLALGKYQQRVTPVLLMSESSDQSALSQTQFANLAISPQLADKVKGFEYVIVDPLGQLVMGYQLTSEDLVAQSKGLLADLRKLLKLSRVG
ncbi:hypothetical protein [Vibrio sp. LaRot3]|uniref:hypothetical protein n=1 Tax=Vibrio sp. LaRot3 TaxID=2998829 RepID=UPI0022CDC09E|nr:hypothetical protein [Vibrio sp. LaRot3]MDA0150625.1 hypothetical protein [Vibrio sp. LaRot3]